MRQELSFAAGEGDAFKAIKARTPDRLYTSTVGDRAVAQNQLRERDVRPVVRNKCWWLGPWILDQRGLEPIVPKVGMLGDNQLKTRRVLGREAQKHLEEAPHRFQIRVLLGLLDRTSGFRISPF